MSPEHLNRLKDRAFMLRSAREFFYERDVLEVDCGALIKKAPIDMHIDVISAFVSNTEERFLHTSPEYSMKKLLASGIGDIYFLGHVFRKGEMGRLHNPEFTMAEWYRVGISFEEMIRETCAFLSLFLGHLPMKVLSYKEAFEQYAGIDYKKDSLENLIPEKSWSRKESLHYILSHKIEPFLGKGDLTVLTDYPPDEAALACVVKQQGELVAKRFEIYHQGVELANGYHELSDPSELRDRFLSENAARQKRGQETYAFDEEFLTALEHGFPDCCGVSVGFDRALMLRHKVETLSQVLPSTWTSKSGVS